MDVVLQKGMCRPSGGKERRLRCESLLNGTWACLCELLPTWPSWRHSAPRQIKALPASAERAACLKMLRNPSRSKRNRCGLSLTLPSFPGAPSHWAYTEGAVFPAPFSRTWLPRPGNDAENDNILIANTHGRSLQARLFAEGLNEPFFCQTCHSRCSSCPPSEVNRVRLREVERLVPATWLESRSGEGLRQGPCP